MQVTVDDKEIQNNDCLTALDRYQRIKFNYPYEKGKLYTLLGTVRRVTTINSLSFIVFLQVNVTMKDTLTGDSLEFHPFIDKRENKMIHNEYCIKMYEQDSHIPIVMEEFKEKAESVRNLVIAVKEHRVGSVSLLNERRFDFTVENKDLQLVPGMLTPRLFRNLSKKDIWKLIVDYSIDMKEVDFNEGAIVYRILQWQEQYLANRKL